MIKFKNQTAEFEITDDFQVIGNHKIWVNILESFVEFVSYDFHPENGDPFLILKNKLQKMGFEILDICTSYNHEETY